MTMKAEENWGVDDKKEKKRPLGESVNNVACVCIMHVEINGDKVRFPISCNVL